MSDSKNKQNVKVAQYILKLRTDKELIMFEIMRLRDIENQSIALVQSFALVCKEIEYVDELLSRLPNFSKVITAVKNELPLSDVIPKAKACSFYKNLQKEVIRFVDKVIKYEEQHFYNAINHIPPLVIV